jgi:GT2 family glycosyltransferase
VGSRGNARPRVAIVVLSWNGRDDTLGCLASLRAVEHEPLDVVVVDNGSTDDTDAAVRAEFPEVELVRSEENLGFAEGNDVGIRRALERGADHVLVLNNDVEVEPGFVTALVEEAERRPDAGALCPKILYFEPRDRIWFVGAAFDPRSGRGRHIRYRELDDPAETAVTETDRVCGAAMLVRRRVLEEVGGFDPEFFLYAEDTEWSLRARAAGLRHYVVPRSRVYHKVSGGSGGENMPTPLYYALRNTLVVCERWAPLGQLGTWRRRAVVVAAHAAQALTSPERAESLRAVRDGWRDFRRGRLGKRP